jgi:glycosyltransferase involved in cell wall biosynthesis
VWLENSPLVIHEAFMAGLPVVGARIGGIAELIEEGHTGLLYDPSSPGELAAALQRLIGSPDLVHRLHHHVLSRPRVKSIDEDAREWEVVYSEVLGRRGLASLPG